VSAHNVQHFVLHFCGSTFNGVSNNNNDDDDNLVIVPPRFLHEIVVYTDTAVYLYIKKHCGQRFISRLEMKYSRQ